MNDKEKNKFEIPSKFISAILISSIFIFLFFPFISAQPPFQQENIQTAGYQIELTQIDKIYRYQDFTFDFHVKNISNGYPIDNSSTRCFLHLQDTTGKNYLNSEIPHLEEIINNDWGIKINGSSFEAVGRHGGKIQCFSNVTNLGGIESFNFEVSGGNLLLFIIGFIIFYGLTFYGIKIINPWVSLVGCFGLCLTGIYTSTNGIDIYQNLLVDAISYITIAIGLGIGFESLIKITEL